MSIFQVNTTPNCNRKVSKAGKVLGWPERHTFRSGRYYKFYGIYNTLDSMIQNQKINERLSSPLNFTKHEIEELEDIRERLETLRKNRCKAYWEIKQLEQNEQNI